MLGLTVTGGPNQRRLARFVVILATSGLAAALVACGLALVGAAPHQATLAALAILAAVCATTLWTALRGFPVPAGRVLFLACALGTTAMLLTGSTVGFGATAGRRFGGRSAAERKCGQYNEYP